ncbi:hypothetical protein F511_01682 [Dorcoceras hygrometricum]|nr:hypothetical protein F511_01682 [Dorcoceras hygrometricum]
MIVLLASVYYLFVVLTFEFWYMPQRIAGSPATYAEAVDSAVDIDESLLEVQNPVQPIDGRSFQPVPEGMQSFQPPQTSQQSNHQRFKPQGIQFKRRSNSSSSGSVSSGGSGSGRVKCGQCGGRHMTSQCHGVQGPCQRDHNIFPSPNDHDSNHENRLDLLDLSFRDHNKLK